MGSSGSLSPLGPGLGPRDSADRTPNNDRQSVEWLHDNIPLQVP